MRARNGLVGRWTRPFASGVQPLPAVNKLACWRKGNGYGPAPDCAALPPVFTSGGGLTWSARTLPGHVQQVVDFVDVAHGWPSR
jgi:hypothetical protein